MCWTERASYLCLLAINVFCQCVRLLNFVLSYLRNKVKTTFHTSARTALNPITHHYGCHGQSPKDIWFLCAMFITTPRRNVKEVTSSIVPRMHCSLHAWPVNTDSWLQTLITQTMKECHHKVEILFPTQFSSSPQVCHFYYTATICQQFYFILSLKEMHSCYHLTYSSYKLSRSYLSVWSAF